MLDGHNLLLLSLSPSLLIGGVLMAETETTAPDEGSATAVNRSFYNRLWSRSRLSDPAEFNTWPFLSSLIPDAAARLEIGPGLRPRLPLGGTHFLDLSDAVVDLLRSQEALAHVGDATHLPFADDHFDLVCALDVIEHVDDHLRAFSELSRVLKAGGVLVLSVPLHPSLWTSFDRFVGHVRRYEPEDLMEILRSHGLMVEKSAIFGMQPANSRLLDLGIWFLTHQQRAAIFFYNWLILPLRLLFQKRLYFSHGMLDTKNAPEVLLVCRRAQ
jgi:SAM-dependent methyltransferase